MKFTTDTKILKDEIAEAGNFTQNGIGLGSKVNMVLEGNTLTVRAKCQESGYIGSVAVTGEEDGSATVPAERLITILGSMPQGDIVLETKDEDLIIKQKKIRFKLRMSDPGDHFKFPVPENWKTVPQGFADAVSRVACAVSKDMSKIQLTGVYAEHADGELCIVATDGRWLSMVTIPGQEGDGKMIIPVRFIEKMARRPVVEYFADRNSVWFRGNGKTYMSSLIIKEYPAYRRVIPSVNDYSNIRIDRRMLESSIKRISLVSDKTSKRIRIVLKDGTMTISSSGPMGNATETFPVTGSPEQETEIFVSFRYLEDAVSSSPAETLTLFYKSGLAPLVLQDTGLSWTAVIMPMNAA